MSRTSTLFAACAVLVVFLCSLQVSVAQNEFDCGEGCLNGVCMRENYCNCNNTGYVGNRCETPICDPPCINGGMCVGPNTCNCSDAERWIGERCEIAICDMINCNHGGDCVAPNACNCTATGYEGVSCEFDVDECKLQNNDTLYCDPLTTCSNTNGSFVCSDCPAGYRGNGKMSRGGCVDVDECQQDLSLCADMGEHVVCSNTVGSYECVCATGYQGNTTVGCSDEDECALQKCDPLTSCTNDNGNFSCTACPVGYNGDGKTGCVDVDECSLAICSPVASCLNLPGNFSCSCPEGYLGDGMNCSAVCNVTCMNGGVCIRPNECDCLGTGFSGLDCSVVATNGTSVATSEDVNNGNGSSAASSLVSESIALFIAVASAVSLF